MKTTFTLLIASFIFVSSQAQEVKNIAHSLEINAEYFQIMPRQYYNDPFIANGNFISSSRGGYRYGTNLKYSLSLKKWFLDGNLAFLNNRTTVREAFIDFGEINNLSYHQNLNYLNPEFSFGRFFQVSKNFRINFALGFGTSFLLNKKSKEFSIVTMTNDSEYNFYEGQVSFYHEARLALSMQIGIYIPLGQNELSIKLLGYGTPSTTSYLDLRKIVDYKPQPILEDAAGYISSTLLGISIGYRFNSFKSKQK